MAVGAAIAERFLAARFGELFSHKTYAFISDGGVQEEISQGAGRLAGYLGLNNLIHVLRLKRHSALNCDQCRYL
jgi:transketolase